MLKIEAIGNLGYDAEIKNINGRDVLSYSIAHSEKKSNGESTTTWVECLHYTNNPERLKPYLVKGKSIHVRGNMNASTWVDRQGATRISITCYVSEFDFCGGAKQDNQSTGATPANNAPVAPSAPMYAAPTQTPPPPTSRDMFMPNGDPNNDLPF